MPRARLPVGELASPAPSPNAIPVNENKSDFRPNTRTMVGESPSVEMITNRSSLFLLHKVAILDDRLKELPRCFESSKLVIKALQLRTAVVDVPFQPISTFHRRLSLPSDLLPPNFCLYGFQIIRCHRLPVSLVPQRLSDVTAESQRLMWLPHKTHLFLTHNTAMTVLLTSPSPALFTTMMQ